MTNETKPEACGSAWSALLGMPKVEDALAYSRNFADASPYLTNTAKEHIHGLCALLEAQSRVMQPMRDFVEVCAASAGNMVNGNQLAEMAAALLPNAD